MKCFDKNNRHSGKYLEVIDSYRGHWNVDYSIRWCSECGAIVVDQESDGRYIGPDVPMRWPNVTRRVLNGNTK